MAGADTSTVEVPAGAEVVASSEKEVNPSGSGIAARIYVQMGRESKRLVLALLTTIVPPIALQLIVGNFLLTLVVFAVPFLAWGIRLVPKYHNGLLSLFWVRRTRIGFYEGVVWVPWFIGGRLQYLDIRRRMHDMPEEDNWTTDSMHLVYDIVLQYGIAKVEENGFFRNFFQFFICLFQYQRNAVGLYNFTNLDTLESAIRTMGSIAADLTITAVNSRGFAEIFQQNEGAEPAKKSETIQEEVIVLLNQELVDMGLVVHKYELRDVDFHEDTAQILQKRFLARIRGEAQEQLYNIVREVAKKLTEAGADVAKTAVDMQIAEAFKNAAEKDGILGMLMQALAAHKVLPRIESQT